jgi:hypothetical protein
LSGLRLIPALASLITNTRPSLLNTDIGKLGVGTGQGDDTVLSLGAGGDGVDDVKTDDLAYKDLTEEIARLVSEGLKRKLLIELN